MIKFRGENMNYIAILVAAAVSIIVGFLWYGPLFGKIWQELMGFTKKDLEKAKGEGMGKSYFIMVIGTLITTYVLAYLIDMTGSVGYIDGAIIGFWAWIGFIATTTIGAVLWEKKSWKWWFLNNAHSLVNLLVIGAIIGVWV